MNTNLDPVLAEIRAVREAYAERFAGNVKGLLADLRLRQQQGARKVVARGPKLLSTSKEKVSTVHERTSR